MSFLRKAFFLLFSIIIFHSDLLAQCSNIPVTEAVVNGSFEKGYLKTGSSGTLYADNTPVIFKSGLMYAGDWSPTSSCKYSLGDQWAITRQETTPCLAETNQVPYGVGYIAPNIWKDHTTGTKNGYALVGDFLSLCGNGQGSLYTGGSPVAWAQDVTVFTNQTYYFSTWIAQYTSNPSTTNCNLVVIPYDGTGNLLLAQKQTIATAALANATMQWQQFYGTWNSSIYTKAFITIEINTATTDCAAAGDIAIDDISFINGCQNISLLATLKPDLGTNFSLCATNGTATINSQVSANAGTGRVFSWYSGAGSTQTLLTASGTQNTYSITSPGTYRVCVTDPASGTCAVSSTVVVDKSMNVTISGNDICSPSYTTLTATVLPAAASGAYTYGWTSPVGTGSAPSFSTSSGGLYTVSVTNSAVSGCSATGNKTVISNLPTTNPSPGIQCMGSTAPVPGLGTGPNAANYRWWSASTGGTLLASGANPVFTFPSSGTAYAVYAEDATSTPITGSPLIGSPTLSGGAIYDSKIEVLQTLKLASVDVKPESFYGQCAANGSTSNFIIQLTDLSGTVVQAAYQTLICGSVNTFNLNFTIQPGSYYLKIKNNSGTTSGSFGAFSFTPVYPYTIASYINVYANTTSPSNGGPFGKYVLGKVNGCDRVQVYLPIVSCCTQPTPTLNANNNNNCVGGSVTFTAATSAAGAIYEWSKSGVVIPGITSSTLTYPLLNSSNTGNYTVKTKSSSVCSNSSVSSTAVSLVVNSLPDTTSTITGVTLKAKLNAAAYKWFVCGNTTTVLGTSQSFTPTATGNYYLNITANNCTATSACKYIDFTITNVHESDVSNNISIYPNPASDLINIAADQNINGKISIADVQGNTIYETTVADKDFRISTQNFSNGVYILNILGTSHKLVIVK